MTNRLVNASSPYLLQHAHNPVDWYPWGEEALERARAEDRPIFLSIGYSACHWCHVMERESFEDASIARLMNENFVNIKVDREERPDLDQIYMAGVMALLNGHGGWPLSAFLTPEGEVFYGGTYWPPEPRQGMPGFSQVLERVAAAWRENRQQVQQQAGQVTQWLQQALAHSAADEAIPDSILAQVLVAAGRQLEAQFDPRYGGFGQAPKFPHAIELALLLRLARRWPGDQSPGAERLLHIVTVSLDHMARGGIYDHLGGGFARYSVDERWLVPHFEKMLYDNALLARLYCQAYAAAGHEPFAHTARETLDYLLRDMRHTAGGFYSAEDADSEGVEGKFYVWDADAIHQALGAELGELVCRVYDVSPEGNFEGHNILNLPKTLAQCARLWGLDGEQLQQQLSEARRRLLEVRSGRVRPGRDEKILVMWNALAIEALAEGAVTLGQVEYLAAAQQAAGFILEQMRDSRGRLLHSWFKGTARLDAYLDDYAAMVSALTTLYQVDGQARWLRSAVELAEQMVRHFHDPDGGGFFYTANDHERLIARTKDFQDSSTPSGNALAACALWTLGTLLEDEQWRRLAQGTVACGMQLAQRAPQATGQLLLAVEAMLDQPWHLVLVQPAAEAAAMPRIALNSPPLWLPQALWIVHSEASTEPPYEPLQPWLQDRTAVRGQLTLYPCRGHACDEPVSGPEEIRARLEQLTKDTVTLGELTGRPTG